MAIIPTRRPKLDQYIVEQLDLRRHVDAKLRACRISIRTIDALSKALSGKAFFSLREAEKIIEAIGDLSGIELFQAILDWGGGTNIKAHGLENIPPNGPVVVAATHPTGILDVVGHTRIIHTARKDVRVVANRKAMPFLDSDLILPVSFDNRHEVISSEETVAKINDHLEQGNALLVFGSGRIANMRRGRLFEPPWKKGATIASLKANAPVVPAALDAKNSLSYYRTRRIATILAFGDGLFGGKVAALRFLTEFLGQVGGTYDARYGSALRPGCDPQSIQHAAEGLFRGLYG